MIHGQCLEFGAAGVVGVGGDLGVEVEAVNQGRGDTVIEDCTPTTEGHVAGADDGGSCATRTKK